jgi:hypothetical protein
VPDRVRIEIGFDGGQSLGVSVDNAIADELERALASAEPRAGAGEGALTFDAEDGRYTVALRRVAFIRRSVREGRVGFGAS